MKYKISVVIPVYKVEMYLEQTIKSVIKQTIGFKKNIQMILVNDGSPDNSEAICLKYIKKYPNNIVYHKQKNSGVSVARNVGLQYAEGKYINFLDSDDYIKSDYYEKAYNMLENNNDIDLVCGRLKYFEASNRYHWLDYKFTGDRIINIMKEPENILLHMATAVIRTSVMKEQQFDYKLKISEDTKILYQIILKKEKYGIISSTTYYYRRRKDATSAIQTSREKKYWYNETLENCHDFLIDMSIKKYGKVIQYVQYFLMYDIQWRIKTEILSELTKNEKEEYKEKIRKYIKLIDDDVIAFQKQMSLNYKLIALHVKYEEDFKKYLEYKENAIYFKNKLFANYEDLINYVEIAYVDINKLKIEGNSIDELPMYYKTNGKNRTKINTFQRVANTNIFGEKYNIKKYGYNIEIPLKDINKIEFEIKVGKNYHTLTNQFIHFSRINNFKAGYYYDNKYLFTKSNENKTINVKYKPFGIEVFFREIYFLAYILLKRGLYKQFFMRLMYWLSKPFISKNIWLFADREFMARDSAEILFKYVNNQPNNNKRHTYFVIDKNYDDFERMKQYGKVIGYHTMKYRILFLNAKYLISSHADGYVNNAFGSARKFYVDLYNFKYIYLTHGILLHDSSAWLNRINKNITLNVVTSPLEYKSILEGNYYFKPDQLIKTGIPRYDNLVKKDVKEENKILIMASWRSTLVGTIIPGTQRRKYNPKFKDSEYFKFYDRLFNDEKLQKVLKEKSYKMKFCIHPSFREQFNDFKGNEFVDIAIDVDSQYETKSSKMIITDYSSAACDFAYLRKPVIYANFDLDHIYEIHYYNKGYFDYDINGYGPNCKTYEDTVNEIIKCINNDCKMEEKYIKRCDKFFYYKDGNNSKRVYEEICKLDEKLNK